MLAPRGTICRLCGCTRHAQYVENSRGDGSVGKVLGVHAGGVSSDSQHPPKKPGAASGLNTGETEAGAALEPAGQLC